MSRARTVTEKFCAPNDIWGGNLFKIFAEQVGNPKRVAQLLHVTEQTVKRWMGDNSKVPRAAVLALYWETQYGRGQMQAELLNEIQMLRLHIKIVDAQLDKAKDMVSGMRRIHTGTANEPYFEELARTGVCLPNRHEAPKPLPLFAGVPPKSAAHAWK